MDRFVKRQLAIMVPLMTAVPRPPSGDSATAAGFKATTKKQLVFTGRRPFSFVCCAILYVSLGGLIAFCFEFENLCASVK
jgi:hypothetical protein